MCLINFGWFLVLCVMTTGGVWLLDIVGMCVMVGGVG